MACGCSKSKNVGIQRFLPQNTRRNVTGQISNQLRNSGVAPQSNPAINEGSITAEQRKTQAIRRDAIRRALGR